MTHDKDIEEDIKLITMGNLVRSMFTSVSILHLMLNDTKDNLNFCNSHWSIIAGNIYKHTFFASKKKDTLANLDDLDNVPYFYTIQRYAYPGCEFFRSK